MVPREERTGERVHVGPEGGNRQLGQEIRAPDDPERSPDKASWAPGEHILTPADTGLDRGPVKPGAKAGPLLLGSQACCEQLLLSCACARRFPCSPCTVTSESHGARFSVNSRVVTAQPRCQSGSLSPESTWALHCSASLLLTEGWEALGRIISRLTSSQ